MENSVYLDNNATTLCDPRVVEKMLPYFSDIYGNPANGFHIQGRKAAKAVENAREQIAKLIGAKPFEIFFTSGASESNNLAIFGTINNSKLDSRNSIITSQIEHKAVLNPCRKLLEKGYNVIFLPVNSHGEIRIDQIKNAINHQTLLVTLHLANNEIGTIQPIQKVTDIAHKYGAIVHSDAAQAVGKIPVNVDDLGIDMLSFSAHKLYGPKGIGALYIRGGLKNIPLEPIVYGGGQEKGLRSGTTNVPGIVGFGEAAQICNEDLNKEIVRIRNLRDQLEDGLIDDIPKLIINAQISNRLPNTSSVIFTDIESDELLFNLPNIMLSTGSACNSGADEPSHVITALGISRELAYRTVRFSLGRFTTQEQISQVISEIISIVEILRAKKNNYQLI